MSSWSAEVQTDGMLSMVSDMLDCLVLKAQTQIFMDSNLWSSKTRVERQQDQVSVKKGASARLLTVTGGFLLVTFVPITNAMTCTRL